MLSDPAQLAAFSALLFELPQALAEARLLSVHRPDLFEHASLGIVETLDDRAHHPHVVAQARDLSDQPLQRLADKSQVNDRLASILARLASILAQDGISFSKAILSVMHRVGKLGPLP
jgi:hypothetical protein